MLVSHEKRDFCKTFSKGEQYLTGLEDVRVHRFLFPLHTWFLVAKNQMLAPIRPNTGAVSGTGEVETTTRDGGFAGFECCEV